MNAVREIARASLGVVACVLLSGCIGTQSMGRMHPLMPAERELLTCTSIKSEINTVDQFCEYIDTVNDVSCKEYIASVAALVIPAVQYGVILTQATRIASYEEAKEAMKSASIRRAYLTRATESLGCEESPRSHCPLLCGMSDQWQVGESDFLCGRKCFRMSRGERRAHSDILKKVSQNHAK